MTEPNYTRADLDRMREDAYRIVKRRVFTECRIQLVEARYDLERVIAGDSTEKKGSTIEQFREAVRARQATLQPLRMRARELREREIEAVHTYRKAYSAYQATLQPVPPST